MTSYLYRHSCHKCDYYYKSLHYNKIRCGDGPMEVPESYKQHMRDNPDHIFFSLEYEEI